MLALADAGLLIGDNALFLDSDGSGTRDPLNKIDLGEVWTAMTGLPFVYAFWAGRPDVLTREDIGALQRARDEGIRRVTEIAAACFSDPRRQAIGARYLRDNIKYDLGDDERAGLELFYEYAAEAGLVKTPQPLRFFETGR
jgi:predicted solute-binding protein